MANIDPKENAFSGDCALCDETNVQLMLSHIIPKFVYDWMKETSPTPYLRSSDNVEERQQDGQKLHLLCKKCELALSSMENELSQYLFKRLANYQKQKSVLVISERVRVAVLSIFWRALYTSKNRDASWTEEDRAVINTFLLGAKNQIKKEVCEIDIYLTPIFGEPPYYNFPIGMTYMLDRSVGHQDIRFFDNPHRYLAIVKLPFMFFHIFGGSWPDSEKEKSIRLCTGSIDLRNAIEIPNVLRDYIELQSEQYERNIVLMNAATRARIAKEISKSEKITGSDKSAKRSGWTKVKILTKSQNLPE